MRNLLKIGGSSKKAFQAQEMARIASLSGTFLGDTNVSPTEEEDYEIVYQETQVLSLHLTLHQGDGLAAKDKNAIGQRTSSDPYCSIEVWPQGIHSTAKKCCARSRTIPETLSPVWNQTFEPIHVPMQDLDPEECVLRVQLMDDDFGVEEDDSLGSIDVYLQPTRPLNLQNKWYAVSAISAHGATGRLQISLQTKPNEMVKIPVGRSPKKNGKPPEASERSERATGADETAYEAWQEVIQQEELNLGAKGNVTLPPSLAALRQQHRRGTLTRTASRSSSTRKWELGKEHELGYEEGQEEEKKTDILPLSERRKQRRSSIGGTGPCAMPPPRRGTIATSQQAPGPRRAASTRGLLGAGGTSSRALRRSSIGGPAPSSRASIGGPAPSSRAFVARSRSKGFTDPNGLSSSSCHQPRPSLRGTTSSSSSRALPKRCKSFDHQEINKSGDNKEKRRTLTKITKSNTTSKRSMPSNKKDEEDSSTQSSERMSTANSSDSNSHDKEVIRNPKKTFRDNRRQKSSRALDSETSPPYSAKSTKRSSSSSNKKLEKAKTKTKGRTVPTEPEESSSTEHQDNSNNDESLPSSSEDSVHAASAPSEVHKKKESKNKRVSKQKNNHNSPSSSPAAAPPPPIIEDSSWTCICGYESKSSSSAKFCGICANPQYWKCQDSTCRFEENKCIFRFCCLCGTPKKKARPPTVTGPWPCPECSFQENLSFFQYCSGCAAPKPNTTPTNQTMQEPAEQKARASPSSVADLEYE